MPSPYTGPYIHQRVEMDCTSFLTKETAQTMRAYMQSAGEGNIFLSYSHFDVMTRAENRYANLVNEIKGYFKTLLRNNGITQKRIDDFFSNPNFIHTNFCYLQTKTIRKKVTNLFQIALPEEVIETILKLVRCMETCNKQYSLTRVDLEIKFPQDNQLNIPPQKREKFELSPDALLHSPRVSSAGKKAYSPTLRTPAAPRLPALQLLLDDDSDAAEAAPPPSGDESIDTLLEQLAPPSSIPSLGMQAPIQLVGADPFDYDWTAGTGSSGVPETGPISTLFGSPQMRHSESWCTGTTSGTRNKTKPDDDDDPEDSFDPSSLLSGARKPNP